jgi:hypothetical protein
MAKSKISLEVQTIRKKLRMLSIANPSDFIELIEHDIDLVTLSSIKKVVLFNTLRWEAGQQRCQVMKPKDASSILSCGWKIQNPEYYRKSESLNAIGFYLKPGDEI